MTTATFTKGRKELKATALNDAGMGFLANLVCRGWYTEAEAFDLCLQYSGNLVSTEVRDFEA